jgi:hypothetical protein
MLDRLIASATEAGYARIVLGSPDFMTAAHTLYRSSGLDHQDWICSSVHET